MQKVNKILTVIKVGNEAESGSEAESFNLVRAIQQVREMDVQQDGHVARAATALYGEGADDGDASGLDTDEEEDRDDIRNTSIRNPFIDDMAGKRDIRQHTQSKKTSVC